MKTRLEAFAAAVLEMREAQKTYSRMRQDRASPEVYGPVLKEARRLERKVDALIVAMEISKGQSEMFE